MGGNGGENPPWPTRCPSAQGITGITTGSASPATAERSVADGRLINRGIAPRNGPEPAKPSAHQPQNGKPARRTNRGLKRRDVVK